MISYSSPRIVGIRRGKKIGERSKEELLGSSFREFMDSDRYETKVSKNPHILIFKLTFDYPWSVSVNQTEILEIKICNQEFPVDLIP